MAAGIVGLDDLTLISTDKGWNRGTGETRIEVWEGPITKINERFELLKNTPDIDKIQKSTVDGKGRLNITIVNSGDEVPGSNFADNAVWELIGQDLYKGLRAHQTFSVAADQSKLEDTRKFYEEGLGGVGPHDSDGAPFTTYLNLLRRGTEEFVRSVAILRQSLVVGSRSTEKADWENVDRAVTLSGTGLDGTGAQAIIGAIDTMPEANSGKKQWLKRAPQLRTSGDRRFTIVLEFWYAKEWSKVLYEGDEGDDNP